MKGGGGGVESTIVPEAVIDSVKKSLVNLEDVRVQLMEFFTLSEPDILAELPPLCRAQALVLLAKATSSLLSLRLRCNGVQPDDHPIKTEFERLSLYQEKVERCMALSKELSLDGVCTKIKSMNFHWVSLWDVCKGVEIGGLHL